MRRGGSMCEMAVAQRHAPTVNDATTISVGVSSPTPNIRPNPRAAMIGHITHLHASMRFIRSRNGKTLSRKRILAPFAGALMQRPRLSVFFPPVGGCGRCSETMPIRSRRRGPAGPLCLPGGRPRDRPGPPGEPACRRALYLHTLDTCRGCRPGPPLVFRTRSRS